MVIRLTYMDKEQGSRGIKDKIICSAFPLMFDVYGLNISKWYLNINRVIG